MCLFIQSKVVGVVLSESTLMIHVSSGLCSSALLLVSSVFRESRNWLAGTEGRKTKREGGGQTEVMEYTHHQERKAAPRSVQQLRTVTS